MNIITKLDPLSGINEETSKDKMYEMIDTSINTSYTTGSRTSESNIRNWGAMSLKGVVN